MKVIDAVNQSIHSYPTLYLCDNYEDSKFLVLHHYFIVLGNGIEWAHVKDPKKGGYLTYPKSMKINDEWVRKYDLPYGNEQFPLDPRLFNEKVYQIGPPTKGGFLGKNLIDFNDRENRIRLVFESDLGKYSGYVMNFTPYDSSAKLVADLVTRSKRTENPYPNFQKKYSCFWKIDPKLIQDDWKAEGLAHLKHWQVYFSDKERVNGYPYYPNPVKLKKWILEHQAKKPKESQQQFVDRINKDYGTTVFNGSNWSTFANERWEKEYSEIIQFIDETIKRLQ